MSGISEAGREVSCHLQFTIYDDRAFLLIVRDEEDRVTGYMTALVSGFWPDQDGPTWLSDAEEAAARLAQVTGWSTKREDLRAAASSDNGGAS